MKCWGELWLDWNEWVFKWKKFFSSVCLGLANERRCFRFVIWWFSCFWMNLNFALRSYEVELCTSKLRGRPLHFEATKLGFALRSYEVELCTLKLWSWALHFETTKLSFSLRNYEVGLCTLKLRNRASHYENKPRATKPTT